MSRRPPNRFSAEKEHRTHGIKIWIKGRSNVNGSLNIGYEGIINAYCESKKYIDNPTIKGLSEFQRRELFVQNNFTSFCFFYMALEKEAILKGETFKTQSKSMLQELHEFADAFDIDVEEKTPYHIRLNHNVQILDFYPKNQKWHDVSKCKRGTYQEILSFIETHFNLSF